MRTIREILTTPFWHAEAIDFYTADQRSAERRRSDAAMIFNLVELEEDRERKT